MSNSHTNASPQRRVLDVGNCRPDHAAIRRLVEGGFGAEVVQAHGLDDALAELLSGRFDLVLVNRKLDRDYSDGIDIIRAVKADPALATTPIMLVTNYAEHQDAAVALGAERGFGKLEFDKPETRERLARFLG
ncbi:MAG: response regulator [Planctomycetota bacterium]|nr:MAG: response regulator [Planctomycetota bacterium]